MNNILEYNIISRTNTETDDTGAIEVLGSGQYVNLANTIRFNNITDTVEASSSP